MKVNEVEDLARWRPTGDTVARPEAILLVGAPLHNPGAVVLAGVAHGNPVDCLFLRVKDDAPNLTDRFGGVPLRKLAPSLPTAGVERG